MASRLECLYDEATGREALGQVREHQGLIHCRLIDNSKLLCKKCVTEIRGSHPEQILAVDFSQVSSRLVVHQRAQIADAPRETCNLFQSLEPLELFFANFLNAPYSPSSAVDMFSSVVTRSNEKLPSSRCVELCVDESDSVDVSEHVSEMPDVLADCSRLHNLHKCTK